MIQLVSYDKQVCLMSHSFGLKLGACMQPLDFLELPKAYFFLMRRILVILCLCELVRTLYNFAGCICRPPPKLRTLWNKDRFVAMPPQLKRRFQCMFSFVEMNTWLLLTYAVATFSPQLMWPWLIYYLGYIVIWLFKVSILAIGRKLNGKGISTAFEMAPVVLKIILVTVCKRNYDMVLTE